MKLLYLNNVPEETIGTNSDNTKSQLQRNLIRLTSEWVIPW